VGGMLGGGAGRRWPSDKASEARERAHGSFEAETGGAVEDTSSCEEVGVLLLVPPAAKELERASVAISSGGGDDGV